VHQSKKGNQWYFGMKAHIGVDAVTGLVHTVVGTSGNVADVTQTANLLLGDESSVHLDAGYTGIEKREEMQGNKVKLFVAAKRSVVEKLPEPERESVKALERSKAQVRALVEHPFHVVKKLFKHRKVRYRGLAKNTSQLFTLFGLANLMLAKRWLLAPQGIIAP
jgi:IS5 family transposase